MLTISKKKLYAFRILMWGGLVVMLVSFVASSINYSLGLCFLIGGLLFSIIGAVGITNLYRCPECDHRLLVVGSRFDALLEKYPSFCPHCGSKIKLELK